MIAAHMVLRAPDDFHLHVRQGADLKACLPSSTAWCARALVMPNTLPPVSTPSRVRAYREEIRKAAPDFQPLMSFKIMPSMTGDEVSALKDAGCVAGKLYPAGATTNAQDGVSSIDQIQDLLSAMEEWGLVLCVHGEQPEDPILTREISYIPVIEKIAVHYPRLRIVFEHLSTKEAVQAVAAMPSTVAATLTPHHMALTIDDVIGGNMNPYHFCKPVIKQPSDRDAVAAAAVSGNPRFFFGSDSAPHPKASKLSGNALPGIFCAPVAMSVVAEVFERLGALDKMEDFVSRFGAEFYTLPLNSGTVEMEKTPWQVPAEVNGFVPMLAGAGLRWRVIRRAG